MKFRKVAGVTALHYGKAYLAWAIRSVIKDIDEYHILYSPVGSHSVRTDVPCPETRDELFKIAHQEAGDKLHWHDGDWRFEGQQRDAIYSLTDADVLVTVDADEVYYPGLLRAVLAYGEHAQVSDIRVPFFHYWRSMHRVIKHDPAFPVRVRFLPLRKGETTYQIPAWCGDDFRIHHFGYALKPELIKYKWKIHGHINELRRDCDWFNDVFMKNRQTDCHPVGSPHWVTEVCEPPGFMRGHPYFDLEIIE